LFTPMRERHYAADAFTSAASASEREQLPCASENTRARCTRAQRHDVRLRGAARCSAQRAQEV